MLVDAVALMGPGPPQATGPPSAEGADGRGAFGEVIAAMLAAAMTGGAGEQDDASEGPTGGAMPGIALVLQALMGGGQPPGATLEAVLGMTLGATGSGRPDRIAEAGVGTAVGGGGADALPVGLRTPAIGVGEAAMPLLRSPIAGLAVVPQDVARPLGLSASPSALASVLSSEAVLAAAEPQAAAGLVGAVVGVQPGVQPVAQPPAPSGVPPGAPAVALPLLVPAEGAGAAQNAPTVPTLPAAPAPVATSDVDALPQIPGPRTAAAVPVEVPPQGGRDGTASAGGQPPGQQPDGGTRAPGRLVSAQAQPPWAGVPGEGAAQRGGAPATPPPSAAPPTAPAASARADAASTAVDVPLLAAASQGRAAQPALPDTASSTDGPVDALPVASPETAGRQPAAPAAGAQLAEPVDASNRPQMAGRLADTVQRAVRTGEREFSMRLSPPELGTLEVRVTESAEGVRVTLRTVSREAGDLIQLQLPLLRAALEARDLRVDRLDVSRSDLAGSDGAGDEAWGGPRGGEEGESPRWSPLAAMDRETDADAPVLDGGRLDSSNAVDVMA